MVGFSLLQHADHLAELDEVQGACIVDINLGDDALHSLKGELVTKRPEGLGRIDASQLAGFVLLLFIEEPSDVSALVLTETFVPAIKLEDLPDLAQIQLILLLQAGALLGLDDDFDIPGIVPEAFEQVGHLVLGHGSVAISVRCAHRLLNVLQLLLAHLPHAHDELSLVDLPLSVNIHLVDHRLDPRLGPRKAKPSQDRRQSGGFALPLLVSIEALEDVVELLKLTLGEAFSAQDQLHDSLELLHIKRAQTIRVNFGGHLVQDVGHGLHVQVEEQLREIRALDDAGVVLVTDSESRREGQVLALLIGANNFDEMVNLHRVGVRGDGFPGVVDPAVLGASKPESFKCLDHLVPVELILVLQPEEHFQLLLVFWLGAIGFCSVVCSAIIVLRLRARLILGALVLLVIVQLQCVVVHGAPLVEVSASFCSSRNNGCLFLGSFYRRAAALHIPWWVVRRLPAHPIQRPRRRSCEATQGTRVLWVGLFFFLRFPG
mmetsp:Transcript_124647/g.295806  ORF Transcript_124647/g.295806 Transcript_124647/m.295806 type:complete len:490 (-) Transcript_124647:137-1606(-)